MQPTQVPVLVAAAEDSAAAHEALTHAFSRAAELRADGVGRFKRLVGCCRAPAGGAPGRPGLGCAPLAPRIGGARVVLRPTSGAMTAALGP